MTDRRRGRYLLAMVARTVVADTRRVVACTRRVVACTRRVVACTRGVVAAAALTSACAAAPPGSSLPPGEPTAASDPAGNGRAAEAAMVPSGYGTLRQDEVTVTLQSGALLVKVTPLDEATIRLLAPDTYMRLHALRTSREGSAPTGLSRPELFLVSFFSHQPDVTFQPEDLQLEYQARLLRPQAIDPITGGWGRQRLNQQETQSAIYRFEGPIDYDQSFTVRYGLIESGDWQRIVSVLEVERAKIATRAAR